MGDPLLRCLALCDDGSCCTAMIWESELGRHMADVHPPCTEAKWQPLGCARGAGRRVRAARRAPAIRPRPRMARDRCACGRPKPPHKGECYVCRQVAEEICPTPEKP